LILLLIACLILGDEEAANQTVQLKWLASGSQQTLTHTELLATAAELLQNR
jgi:histidyl-tRNA synthetase